MLNVVQGNDAQKSLGCDRSSVVTIGHRDRSEVCKAISDWQRSPDSEHPIDSFLYSLTSNQRDLLSGSIEELSSWYSRSNKGGLIIRGTTKDEALDLFCAETRDVLSPSIRLTVSDIMHTSLSILEDSLGPKNSLQLQLRFESPTRNFIRWHLDLRNRVVTVVTPILGPGSHFAGRENVDREVFYRYRNEFATAMFPDTPSSKLKWAQEILYDKNAPFLRDPNLVVHSTIGQSSIIRDGFLGSAHRGPYLTDFYTDLAANLDANQLAEVFETKAPTLPGRIVLLASIYDIPNPSPLCRWQVSFSSLK